MMRGFINASPFIFSSLWFFSLILSTSVMAEQNCYEHIDETTPTKHFSLPGDGTAIHYLTGLQWLVCPVGTEWKMPESTSICEGSELQMNWSEALTYVDNINSSTGKAGYNDWRIPNIKELSTIIERKCEQPSLNVSVFPELAYQGYVTFWTNTPLKADLVSGANYSWSVNLEWGYDSFGPRKLDSRLILVRDALIANP